MIRTRIGSSGISVRDRVQTLDLDVEVDRFDHRQVLSPVIPTWAVGVTMALVPAFEAFQKKPMRYGPTNDGTASST
jgi:hypothetical protein